MGFRSSFFGARERECCSGLRFVYVFLLMFVTALPCAAGTKKDVPGKPAEESHRTEAKDANLPEKYDIDRIGQRGVGKGFNVYSLKREHELGQSLAAMFDRSTKMINDEVVNEYVNRVAQKIVRYSDAQMPFTVRIIDSGEIPRAYGLPGGFLYVDSALVLATDAEAELAGILAHEIAHVAARHATRALTRKHLYSFVNSMALMTGPAGLVVEDVAGVAGPLSLKKFARDAEYEADLLGIEYAYAAGYDPQALLSALEKLHAMEASRSAAFSKIPGYHLASRMPFHNKIAKGFASYPMTEERISRLQSEIPEFLPDRKDYVVDTNEFQEVKTRLLQAAAPVLHRSGPDEDNRKVPVLRRIPESDPQPNSQVRLSAGP